MPFLLLVLHSSPVGSPSDNGPTPSPRLRRRWRLKPNAVQDQPRSLGSSEDPALTRADLPQVLCGLPSAPLEERPFDATFTEENILRAWYGTVLTSSSLMEKSKLRLTVEGGAEAAAHSPGWRSRGCEGGAHHGCGRVRKGRLHHGAVGAVSPRSVCD